MLVAQKEKVAEMQKRIGGQTTGWMAEFRYEVGVMAGLSEALIAIIEVREAEINAMAVERGEV